MHFSGLHSRASDFQPHQCHSEWVCSETWGHRSIKVNCWRKEPQELSQPPIVFLPPRASHVASVHALWYRLHGMTWTIWICHYLPFSYKKNNWIQLNLCSPVVEGLGQYTPQDGRKLFKVLLMRGESKICILFCFEYLGLSPGLWICYTT